MRQIRGSNETRFWLDREKDFKWKRIPMHYAKTRTFYFIYRDMTFYKPINISAYTTNGDHRIDMCTGKEFSNSKL